MKNAKKLFISAVSLIVLICAMALSIDAVDITIRAKDSNGNFIYGATFEVRASDGTTNTSVPVGPDYVGKIFNLTSGKKYGINVRYAGYAAGWTEITCPSSANTYDVTLKSKTTYKNENYTKPVSFTTSDISSRIGYRYGTLLTPNYGFHSGADIPKPEKTSISSIHNGEVYDKGNSTSMGYWIQTKSTSGTQYYARFMHMYETSPLSIGDPVYTSNCYIGKVGTTGASTNNHLHFEISASTSYSASTAIDPEAFYN